MKKEIVKTAPLRLSWSPRNQYPIHLAAGTAAEQDNSFSSSACIELYDVDLTGPSIDLNIRCSFKSDHRFHKLIWSNESDKNIIVGGCDSGAIPIYDASQLIETQVVDESRIPTHEDGFIACLKSHTGPVRALDFTLQKNLLATATSASEIFVWDLNRELIPIQHLAAAEPLGDIASLSSNKQVQHIIATGFATQCLVWDLRTSKSIIKLSDPSSKIRWKDLKWNPETGSQHTTQLCLASEEDQYPVIQMWDLRLASSPIKVFEGHEKGVLSLDWCDADPDLMITSGKDNKLLLWNLNAPSTTTGEIIRRIPLATEWNFEVSWCPRNPSLISSSSSVGPVTILTWGSDQPPEPTDMIADSFPGMSQYQQPAQPVISNKAPKWLKRTSGVSFGFGGKLLIFGNQSTAVEIRQVVTEPNLEVKFKELETVLEEGEVYTHCVKKCQSAKNPEEKNVWNFIAGQLYGNNFTDQMFSLLGVSKSTLENKLGALNITDLGNNESSCDPSSNISHIGPAEDIFNTIAAQQTSNENSAPVKKSSLKISQNDDVESAISDALVLGNLELAVDLCLKEDKISDAFSIAVSGGQELVAKVQSKYFEKSDNPLTTLISTIVTEDWFNVVDTCDLSSWKQILAALLTYTAGGEFRVLCESLGSRLCDAEDESLKRNASTCFILAGNVNKLIENYNRTKSGSVTEVQELVELALVTREAMKARNIEVPVYGTFSKILLRYAELLASEGYLTEAYSYLGESSEESVQDLKDRLMIALGLKTIEQNYPNSQMNGYSHQQQLHQSSHTQQYNTRNNTQPAYGYPSNPYNQITNNQVPGPPAARKPSPMFSTSSSTPQAPISNYNSVAPSYQYSSSANPTPGSNPFTPQISAQPPRMPAMNPQPPAASFTPPVSAISNPPSSFYNPSLGSQFNQFNGTGAIPPPGISPMPRTSSTPTPPLPPSSQMPHSRPGTEHVTQSRAKYVVDPSVKGGGYGNSAASMAPFTQQPMNPAGPVPSMAPITQQPNLGSFAPQNHVNFYQQSNQNYNSLPPQPNPHETYVRDSQPRYDPPPLSSNSQHREQVGFVKPNPISHPIYGSAIPEQNPMNRPPSAPNMYQQNAGYNPANPWAQPNLPETNHVNQVPNNYQNNVTAQPSIPQKQRIENLPVQKPPLSQEYIKIQTVFENLRNQCVNKTSNLQMKRKLDDTSRKLETLYDAIRDSKLSPRTLQGLLDIIQAIENGNYPECLSLHTQLVSGPDFSAIASFMPGIKVLVQLATQLGVYL